MEWILAKKNNQNPLFYSSSHFVPSLTELTFKSHSFIHYYFFYCIFLDCIIPKSLQESTAHLLTSLHILLRNITASNEETTSSYTSSPIALCCCWNNKFEYFSERYMCHILYMLTVIFISACMHVTICIMIVHFAQSIIAQLHIQMHFIYFIIELKNCEFLSLQ